MPNWTEKQNEMQQQLLDQHNALLSVLGTATNVLDLINTGIGTLRTDLLASLTTLNTSVGGLNTLITAGNGTLTGMNARLSTINSSASQILGKDTLIELQTASLASALVAINAALGIPSGGVTTNMLGRLTAVEALLTEIESKYGEPGDAEGTLLERLQAIQSCICLLAGTAPTPPSTFNCEDSADSTGIVFYPTWVGFGTGVNIATWSLPLPTGISIGTIFGIAEDNTEIDRSPGFGGIMAWVESNAPNFSLGPLETTRYPTNQWVSLPNVPAVAFSVSDEFTIKVTLCLPPPAEEGCYIVGSILQGDGDYIATFSEEEGLAPYISGTPNVLMESAGSYTFTLISGEDVVNPIRYVPGVPGADLVADVPYTTTELPLSTKLWYVRSSSQFVLQICVSVE